MDVPGPFEEMDKVAHFGGYAIMAVLVLGALSPRVRRILVRVVVAVGACFLYGTLMEVLQAVMPLNRELSLGDIAANTAGALAAVCVLALVKHRWMYVGKQG